MKMKMLSLILLLAILLCGCDAADSGASGEAALESGAAAESSGSQADVENAEETEPAAKNQVEFSDTTPDTAGPQEFTGEVQELTVAAYTEWVNHVAYSQQIMDFNEAYPQYHVSAVGMEQTELNTSLLAGDGPDLIDGDYGNLGTLVQKGFLVDLYPLMEQDGLGKEDFVHLELLENGGGLYQIATCFSLWTLLALRSEYESYETWNMEALLDAINRADSPQDVGGNFTCTNLLEQLLPAYIQEHVDYAAGTCDFDTEAFRALLETAKGLNYNADEPNADGEDVFTTYGTYFEKHPQRVMPVMLLTPDDVCNSFLEVYQGTEGLDTFFIGYPTANGGSVQLSFGGRLSLSSQSDCQEGAWAFLRYLLTDAQTNGLEDVDVTLERGMSVNRAALEGRFDWSVAQERLTREQADQALELIYGPAEVCDNDAVIGPIVQEEAQAYFSGNQSLDGVVQVIQSRCSIYLSEQS